MSIRAAIHRFVQNGQVVLRTIQKKPFHSNRHAYKHLNKIHVAQASESQNSLPCRSGNVSSTGKHLGYLGTHARRIFVDNILKRVTNSLAADLRRRAASKLVFGDSAPFFALVGVSLASGTGILTKDDELDGVCWEIREAVSKLCWNMPQNDKNYEAIPSEENIILQDFIIGPIIAKGCSAAVYAARYVDAKLKERSDLINIDMETKNKSTFPLAIKMMFNYNAESNAAAILRAMYRETVPSREYKNKDMIPWEQKLAENTKSLPPHPNIVVMYNVFTDRIPMLPDSWRMYPDALPTRLNPHGSGRNMSLFLLMKRYDVTLKQYLASQNVDNSVRISVLLFAQLLEAIAHMNAYGIAHRDLKSDNILLDLSEETDNCPSLVVTDFGCCLADKSHGLYLPYNTHDIDKGGNVALMAPEVITAVPGPFTSINYTKADLWTAGTIAYEIFGMKNPFHNENDEVALKSYSYSESELPALPDNVPPMINAVIKNLLSKNLHKRLETQLAATVMQLYLWGPSSWLKPAGQVPSNNEILQWLLCLTTKILCEGRNAVLLSRSSSSMKHQIDERNVYKQPHSVCSYGRRTMPEYQLIASFLSRVTLGNVRNAIRWIQQNV